MQWKSPTIVYMYYTIVSLFVTLKLCFSDAVLLRLPLHMMSMSIHVFFLIPEKISIFLLNTKDSVKVVILMCFKGSG
jgi:hypothetical protein